MRMVPYLIVGAPRPRDQGAKIPVRPRGFSAQPVFDPHSDRKCHPEMLFLYLVVMVAANTKYSINSFLSPAPSYRFLVAVEISANPFKAPPFKMYRPDLKSDFD
jgi:hypothetical protein